MATLDTIPINTDYRALAIIRLHQLRGDSVDISTVIDSSSLHQLGGKYWGNRGRNFWRMPLDNRLNATLLAHTILRVAGETEAADQAVNYLLGQSASSSRPGIVPLLGTNTLESARLVDELLPILIGEAKPLAVPTVSLSGLGKTETIKSFPYEKSFPASKAPAVRLKREGSGPIPGVLYQQYFEREPVASDDGFSITSRITDARDRPLDKLKKGETAYLEVSVTAKADGEYVLIEVPIPAGCSYADRSEPKGRYAVHREYRRDRVAIFCDRLPAGTYTYKISLAPQFAGRYTLNPVSAEYQYLPVVRGSGEMKTITID